MRHYSSVIWCVSGAMRMEPYVGGIVGMQASVLKSMRLRWTVLFRKYIGCFHRGGYIAGGSFDMRKFQCAGWIFPRL